MKKGFVIILLTVIIGGSLVILNNDDFSFLLLLDRSNPEILEITKVKPSLMDEIKKKIDDLIYSLTQGDVTHGLNDLSPMPLDSFNCEDSGCTHTEPCSVHNYKEGQTTHRLWQNVKEGEHKYLMDWQYDGWTVNDAVSSHYTDYSKFSDRTTKNQDKEYLFQWKINNYNFLPEGGRQRFTFEYRNSGYTPGSITFDESTRNGSFVKAIDGTEWLDLGENGLFEAQDGRIKCAFAPMVTAGQAALQNLVSAKGWFHRGDVWYGSEDSFRGLALWQNYQIDCPKGTYIDVVFKNNSTGKEVVIPFVFSDAKNIHHFGSAGQRVDQRYGQCRVEITKSGTNGYREVDMNKYSCTVRKVASSLEDYLDKYGEASLDNFKIYTYAQLKQYFKKSDISNFYDGQSIYDVDGVEHIKDRIIVLNDGNLGKFDNWTVEKQRETILNYSDDDQMTYTVHTALELMRVAYTPAMKAAGQDGNYYIAQVLLDGFYFEGNANRTVPNWSLKCMRAYTGKVANSNEFTEVSKNMPKVSSIENNKIIDFCSPECKCNICIEVAK